LVYLAGRVDQILRDFDRQTVCETAPAVAVLQPLLLQSFGTRELADQWLTSLSAALGARPIDLLRTVGGRALVHDVLGRIATGTYT
jgi:uncharacterized protein (DUF2384 family)